MCFEISPVRKSWPNTLVYKVVQKVGADLVSPQSNALINYNCTRPIQIRKGTRTKCEGKTLGGLYVCRSLEAARVYARKLSYGSDLVIIELRVKRGDFLHGPSGHQPRYVDTATYRRVKFTGRRFNI